MVQGNPMPKNRPKPKWGHRAKGMLEDLDKEHYSKKQVAKLAVFLPKEVNLDELKNKLDITVNQYSITRT